MRTTVFHFILYTLAVAAVGVPIEFTLGDGAVSPNHTLESSDFEVISDMLDTIVTEEEIESSDEPILITLSMIEDENMLTQLKRFWCEEASEDIGPDQFSRFIRASNYLSIRGDTSMRFGRNMARAALLGMHASAIFKTFPYANPLNGWNITWQMLIGFAAQTGCEARVSITDEEVTLCSAGARGAEAYGTPASEFKKRPVIRKLSLRCDILGNASDAASQNVSSRMAILTWFLCHLGVPSLSIGSEFGLAPGDIQCFSQALFCIKRLEQIKRLGKALVLEELDLSRGPHLDSQAIKALIPSLPYSLKELWINIDNFRLSRQAAGVFKKCNRLEKLHISESMNLKPEIIGTPTSLASLYLLRTGIKQHLGLQPFGFSYLDSETIEILISNLPSSLKELWIGVTCLDEQVANAFKKCNRLEKLHLYGVDAESSSFVSALIPNVPSLKELLINVESLSLEVADSFEGCKELGKLHLRGVDVQSSSFVSALIPNVPSLKELVISVERLTPSAGHAFKKCNRLEKLHLYGVDMQSSSFVSALIPNVPSLKELLINVERLTPLAGHAFEGCKELEKLHLRGDDVQSSSFVSALIPNVPSLKELVINVESLSLEVADSFEGCKELGKLHLRGVDVQSSSFVSALIPNVPSLKELVISVERLTPSAGHAFKKCNRLEKLHLYGVDMQSSSFVSALIPNVPSLKELVISVERLTPSAGHAFKKCNRLEKLHLYGVDMQSSSFVSALIPNVPSLKELVISVERLTPSAGHAFKKCNRLKKLHLYGVDVQQSSSFVSALIPNVPSLKELLINVESLSLEVADSFEGCKELEKLRLHGVDVQSSSFVSALIPNVPSLKELVISVERLTPSAGHAFKKCNRLEKLHLYGVDVQSSSFVSALIPNVPSLKELLINVESLSLEVADSFEGCKELEKLYLRGDDLQSSSFVSALIPNVPSLKELVINVESLSLEVADSFEGCKELGKLRLCGVDVQSSSFVSALIPNVPSLKELVINVESLSLEVADALKGCDKLEELHISGCLIPGFFKHLLSHPLTDSLKSLTVYNRRSQGGQDPSDEDNQAIAAARERSIQIDILEQ